MEKNKINTHYITHGSARIISIIIVGIFLLFMIGEGILNDFSNLSTVEWGLLLFIPTLFFIAVVISWKREKIGGLLIIFSVIGFNVIDKIASNQFTWKIDFSFILLPGFLFLISGLSKSKGNIK